MKIWFDTEFYENGSTIDLISIGMVREDGATFYGEADLAPEIASQSEWLSANVKPHLRGGDVEMSRGALRRAIIDFAGDKPEFWAYYASYDWVVLCQLFGTMMDLPKGWPMFVRDVQQWRAELGNPDMPAQENEHDALADALWTKAVWGWLSKMRERFEPVAWVYEFGAMTGWERRFKWRESWEDAPKPSGRIRNVQALSFCE